MLSEKIGLEFDLFEVPDRKFGSYDRVGPKVSPLTPDRIHDVLDSVVFSNSSAFFSSFIRTESMSLSCHLAN